MNKKVIIAVVVLVVVGIGIGLIWRSNSNKPFYPVIDSPRPFFGSRDAKVQLELFSDFQCPACKTSEQVIKDVQQIFGDKIGYSYKYYPLVVIHTQAFRAALAAECANDQGKFWEYHDVLYEKQPEFSEEQLISYAKDLGLKEDDFSSCLKSKAKADVVRQDMKEGDDRKIDSTPTFFINGEKVSNWTELKSLIQAKLSGD